MTIETVVRYRTAYNDIRRMAGEQAAALWLSTGGLSQAEIDRYVARMVPVVRGAQVATSRLVAGYLSRMSLEDTGTRFPYSIDPDEIAEPRGVPAATVYARPGVDARTAVKEGKPLQEAMGLGQLRARMLAESDVALAQRASATRAMSTDPRIVGYRRVLTGESCAFCATASVQRYRTDQLMPLHAHCVVGSTVVSGPKALRATSRRYEGEVLTIRTASGNLLTITPNHPVLTDRGWLPAGLLQEGDNVVRRRGGERVRRGVPDEHQVPACIEDRFRALRVRGLARVPLAAEDFHGDVSDGQVNVVDLDSNLRHSLNAAGTQLVSEESFTRRGVRALALADEGPLATLIPRRLPTTHRFMGGRRLGRTFLSGHGCGTHLAGGAAPADRYASRYEMPADHTALDTEGVRESQLGLAVEVAGGDVASRQVNNPAVTRFDPAGTEFSGEGVATYARLGRRLHDRLASEVELDRVVLLSRVDLAPCHVYNLHTTEGWFNANGIIVSNCDCSVAPIIGTEDPGQTINSQLLDDMKEHGSPQHWKDKGWGVDENGVIRSRQVVPVEGGGTRVALGDPVKPTVKVHGELGPTLVDPRHAFTGPAAVPA